MQKNPDQIMTSGEVGWTGYIYKYRGKGGRVNINGNIF